MFSWSSWEFGFMPCCNQEGYNNVFKQRNIPCKWKDYFIFGRLTSTLEFWIWASHLKIIGMTAIVCWKIHLTWYLAFNNGHSWRLISTQAQDGVIFLISKLPGFPKLTVVSMVSWWSNSPSFIYLYFEPIKTCGIWNNQWVWVFFSIMHNTKEVLFVQYSLSAWSFHSTFHGLCPLNSE